MADEEKVGLEVPSLHLAHKHVYQINWLMGEGDRKRTAHLETDENGKEVPKKGAKPDLNPYREMHDYLIQNQVIKSFPSSNGRDAYVFSKVEDFENMDQDDWWLLMRALNNAIWGVNLARDAAKN